MTTPDPAVATLVAQQEAEATAGREIRTRPVLQWHPGHFFIPTGCCPYVVHERYYVDTGKAVDRS